MAIQINDVVELEVRCLVPGDEVISTRLHYVVSSIDPTHVLLPAEVAAAFANHYVAFLVDVLSGFTYILDCRCRLVSGVAAGPGPFHGFLYSQEATHPIGASHSDPHPAMPNGVCYSVIKVTSDLRRYYRGRWHLGLVMRNRVEDDGNHFRPSDITFINGRVDQFKAVPDPQVNWQMTLVILSGTLAYADFQGPGVVFPYTRPVTVLSLSPVVGYITRRRYIPIDGP